TPARVPSPSSPPTLTATASSTDRKSTRLNSSHVASSYADFCLKNNPDRDLDEVAKALDLSAPPRRIEGFDISNISDTFAVASMVSFKHGRPDRTNYRRFKMKTVVGQDDFACIAETVRRRYSRLLRETRG